MLSDRILSALASVGLAFGLLLTAGFAHEVSSQIASPVSTSTVRHHAVARLEPGELVARLTVSRLSLDTPVFEGVEAATLSRGAGHLPGTALPGEEERGHPSLIALARNRSGAAVAGLRLGDLVRLTTSLGPRRYRVTERRLLQPTDFRIAPVSSARITLLAPFPADSFGPAPLRVAVALERLTD